MLDPTTLQHGKETANLRRKSFCNFLGPSNNNQKPRSNSMGVIEVPQHFSSQRFSYQSPSYESPSYQTTPFPRQRTKCFDYPSFSKGKQFDSPIMIVTGGSPSVLEYGRLLNKFSEGVNKKFGCKTILTLVLLSLAAIFSASMFYYSGSTLFGKDFFIPLGIFQKHSDKSILDSAKNAKSFFPDHNSYNLNGRGYSQPTSVNTVVGQHRVSSGFSQINKVAKEKIIFHSKFSENVKSFPGSNGYSETKGKERELKVDEIKERKFSVITTTIKPEELEKMKFKSEKDMHPDGRRDVNPDGRRDVNPDGRRDMHPDGRRDMHPDGRRDMHPDGRRDMHPDGRRDMHPDGRRDMNPDGRRDMNPDGRRDMNPYGRRDMNPDGRRDMNPDGRKSAVVIGGQRQSRELVNTDPKELHSYHDHLHAGTPLQMHEHGYSTFKKGSVWAENRFTIPSNKRKEDLWRNGGNNPYQPQHSYGRPAGIYVPPGINPRLYERGFDF